MDLSEDDEYEFKYFDGKDLPGFEEAKDASILEGIVQNRGKNIPFKGDPQPHYGHCPQRVLDYAAEHGVTVEIAMKTLADTMVNQGRPFSILPHSEGDKDIPVLFVAYDDLVDFKEGKLGETDIYDLATRELVPVEDIVSAKEVMEHSNTVMEKFMQDATKALTKQMGLPDDAIRVTGMVGKEEEIEERLQETAKKLEEHNKNVSKKKNPFGSCDHD